MYDSKMKTMECFGYVVNTSDKFVKVVMPEKPFGNLHVQLPQKPDKPIDKDYYDKYEVKGFELVVDADNNLVDWKFKYVNKIMEVHYFAALFADKRILADDGKVYKVWDSSSLSDDRWISQFDYMFSKGNFSSVENIRLYTKDGVIYGTDKEEAYKFRNGWDIEDTVAKYLGSLSRYRVETY